MVQQVVERQAAKLENESGRYVIYAGIDSPYSHKLRSVMAYRRLPADFVVCTLEQVQALLGARPPMFPRLMFPDGRVLTDSTPLIYELEDRHPDAREVIPHHDAGLAFLAHLIEDFSDELFTIVMFHYRWRFDEDTAVWASRRIAMAMIGKDRPGFDEFAEGMLARQRNAMDWLYAGLEAGGLYEDLFHRVFGILECELFPDRMFLLGDRPSLPDFALYGASHPMASDPAPSVLLKRDYPACYMMVQRLSHPSGLPDGTWDDVAELHPAVMSLLGVVGDTYLPIAAARHDAFMDATDGAGRAHPKRACRIPRRVVSGVGSAGAFELPMTGVAKYAAMTIDVLRDEYDSLAEADRARVDPILAASGCLEYFARKSVRA